jgi:hypothetical protein
MKEFTVDIGMYPPSGRSLLHPSIVQKGIELGYKDKYNIKKDELDSAHIQFNCDGAITSGSTTVGSIIPLGVFVALTKEDVTEAIVQEVIPPFTWVLCRDNDADDWQPGIYGYYKEDNSYPHNCVGSCYSQCILFEGNEKLIGTSDTP